MTDGRDPASGSSLPALPVPQQPAASGSGAGTGAASGTAAIGFGATAIVVIGLGGMLLGIVTTVAAWALVELRKAHRKLAGLEDALWIETEGIDSEEIEGQGIEGEGAVEPEVRTRDPLDSLGEGRADVTGRRGRGREQHRRVRAANLGSVIPEQ